MGRPVTLPADNDGRVTRMIIKRTKQLYLKKPFNLKNHSSLKKSLNQLNL